MKDSEARCKDEWIRNENSGEWRKKENPEARVDWFKPCPHAVPQAASQLHGICIFCYRDRLGELSRLCQFYFEKGREAR